MISLHFKNSEMPRYNLRASWLYLKIQPRSTGYEMESGSARLIAACPQFEGYEPSQNRCRIELAKDAFEIGQASR
jgi:hypothetical protein